MRKYALSLNAETLQLVSDREQDNSAWKSLEFNQCPNCPLLPHDTPVCPVANNLAILIEDCNELQSHNDVFLEVTTSERVISASTTVQRGLSSLLGLILATSDCPHTHYFRPMARFHLPLASEEETIYRAASMYLLAQYFRSGAGMPSDTELNGLVDIYHNLQIVNTFLAKRLRSASDSDATVNAVVLLDLLAKSLPYSITDSLQEVRYLFSVYTDT
jgi:hypothetical protein